MNADLLNKIKKKTISALLSDDLLMGVLVLKGGNALGLAYDITNRGSLDIDFSMAKDFTDAEKRRIKNQASYLLNDEFNKEGLRVIDVDFVDRPGKIEKSVSGFWGGYQLSFKIVNESVYQQYKDNQQALRVNSISLTDANEKTYTVDISKYEYLGKTKPQEIDGTIVHVYTPEMLALEKLRAICQQDKEYRKIIHSMKQRARARDFYDIHNLFSSFEIDFESKENVELVTHIFEAKRVPLRFICKIPEEYDLHFSDWESVLQTIGQKEKVKEFSFYFDFVVNTFKFLCQ